MVSHSLEDNVRAILLYEWDPIGVGSLIEAYDEYDSYVSDICEMIRSGLGKDSIFVYLNKIEEEHMGLLSNTKKNRDVAYRIRCLCNGDT